MELQSKKLIKELKDLENINDADLDTSEVSHQIDLTSAEVGKFQKNTPVQAEKREIN